MFRFERAISKIIAGRQRSSDLISRQALPAVRVSQVIDFAARSAKWKRLVLPQSNSWYLPARTFLSLPGTTCVSGPLVPESLLPEVRVTSQMSDTTSPAWAASSGAIPARLSLYSALAVAPAGAVAALVENQSPPGQVWL